MGIILLEYLVHRMSLKIKRGTCFALVIIIIFNINGVCSRCQVGMSALEVFNIPFNSNDPMRTDVFILSCKIKKLRLK